jgi:cytochrome c5
MWIKTVGRAIAVLAFVSVTSIQVTGGPNQKHESDDEEAIPAGVIENHVMQLPSSQALSPAELAGKKVFAQRCETCHIPATPIAEISAPYLDWRTVAAKGDAAMRKHLAEGSAGRPAFQYTLTSADVDNVLAFIKRLEFDPVAKKYSYVKK